MKKREKSFVEQISKKLSKKFKLKEETIQILIIQNKTNETTYKESKKLVEKFLKIMQ